MLCCQVVFFVHLLFFMCNSRCATGWQDGTAGWHGRSPKSVSSVLTAKQWLGGANL